MKLNKPSGKHFSLYHISKTKVQLVLHFGAALDCPHARTSKFTCYRGDIETDSPEFMFAAQQLKR